MRFLPVSLFALLLSSCGGGYNRLEGPVVDMRNVDQAHYNKDLVECQDRKRSASFVGSARIITDCMPERGYQSIEPRG